MSGGRGTSGSRRRGFFVAPGVQLVQWPSGELREIEFKPTGTLAAALAEIRASLRERFVKLGALPKDPNAPQVLAIALLRWKHSDRLAFEAWQCLNSVEAWLRPDYGSGLSAPARRVLRAHLAEMIAESALWLGAFMQRIHQLPWESYAGRGRDTVDLAKLPPGQRVYEAPRRAQRRRWAPHNAEVELWRTKAREFWTENKDASVSAVSRTIGRGSKAHIDTIRRRIRDLKPAGH